jgi:6-phosphogluconolactonase
MDVSGGTTDRIDRLPENKSSPEIVIVTDRDALARTAAQQFVALAQRSIASHGHFSLALSGGSTPRDLYSRLVSAEFSTQVDWARVHFFWGDERAVPPDHPESNYRMAYEALLSHVNPPPENVHRILAEKQPAEAAREYEETLRLAFLPRTASGTSTRDSREYPRFDLILLGLGANGHTASLFPHTGVLHESTRWVAAEYIDEVKMDRITLTAPAINAAENILFLVAGSDKAVTARAVLSGEYRPEELPAQLIRPADGQLVWLLDRDAASQLSV